MTIEEKERLLAIFHVWSVLGDVLVSVKGTDVLVERHGIFDGFYNGLLYLHKNKPIDICVNDISFVEFKQKIGIRIHILMQMNDGTSIEINPE